MDFFVFIVALLVFVLLAMLAFWIVAYLEDYRMAIHEIRANTLSTRTATFNLSMLKQRRADERRQELQYISRLTRQLTAIQEAAQSQQQPPTRRSTRSATAA